MTFFRQIVKKKKPFNLLEEKNNSILFFYRTPLIAITFYIEAFIQRDRSHSLDKEKRSTRLSKVQNNR